MSEIQRLPTMVNPNPVHPNAKTTTQINNGTTTTKTNISSPVCRNCKTQTTPLWRRDETGQVLCNACGLFLKLHGRPRPISLKTDTIKLRNRIKQPNFSKLLGPNTPELKVKDHKAPGKKLPKNKKKLPALGEYVPVAPVHSPLQRYLGNFPPQMGFSTLPHQVQLLHYPSLTPTQFAPGLQRITSPLLLSTTPSVLNARSTTLSNNVVSPKGPLTAVQAAGALENMSNELGPSATFKAGTPVNGVSLMGSTKRDLSTPSSALNPPKLPALGSDQDKKNIIALPSFGPQFHLLEVKTEPTDLPKTHLPPIQHVSLPKLSHVGPVGQAASASKSPESHPVFMSAATQPPVGQYSAHVSSSSATPTQPGGNSQKNDNPERGDGESSGGTGSNNNAGNDNNNNNSNNNNNAGGSGYEVTLLKTRISELELVNDLYRTRIMELEAMEQAARLRENSMRKRLDEILALQGGSLNNTMKVYKREEEPLAKRTKLN